MTPIHLLADAPHPDSGWLTLLAFTLLGVCLAASAILGIRAARAIRAPSPRPAVLLAILAIAVAAGLGAITLMPATDIPIAGYLPWVLTLGAAAIALIGAVITYRSDI